MYLFLKTLMFIMSFGGILFFCVLFFGSLKYLKKTRLPHWKFPDYVSVGYFGYVVDKFIKSI